jgi:prepilin-type N-terminal cleavage/methylation domain-containing protein
VGPRASGARRSAFTLIEVLVVVVILGIASAIVLPQVTSQDDTSAASAARVVMADLLYAQNRAIDMQTTHYVAFDTANQQYTLYSSMSPATVLQHPVYQNNYVMTFGQSGSNNISQSVTLSSANFNGQTTIAFDETGVPYSYNAGVATPLSSAGTIVLTSGDYSLTISVAPDTGEITVN